MDELTRLFLVRHGETEWNRTMRYQGHRDIPLSEAGLVQAEKIGLRLAKEHIDAAYSSDLSRALDTARAIAQYHNLQVKTSPLLKETNFGLWEGLTYGEIIDQYPDNMKAWRADPSANKVPGGESILDVADRCREALKMIMSENRHKNILVVAHGGIIRLLVAQSLGLKLNDYWKIKMDNVSLSIIEVFEPDRSILCLLNDTCHLKK